LKNTSPEVFFYFKDRKIYFLVENCNRGKIYQAIGKALEQNKCKTYTVHLNDYILDSIVNFNDGEKFIVMIWRSLKLLWRRYQITMRHSSEVRLSGDNGTYNGKYK
jgi:hypothetical protein